MSELNDYLKLIMIKGVLDYLAKKATALTVSTAASWSSVTAAYNSFFES